MPKTTSITVNVLQLDEVKELLSDYVKQRRLAISALRSCWLPVPGEGGTLELHRDTVLRHNAYIERKIAELEG